MNKVLLLAVLASLGVGGAYAADWTPYLSSIKHNCDTTKIHNTLFSNTFDNKKLPKALQASVVKRTGKVDMDNGGAGEVVLQLKNATAFGEPLTKIHYLVHDYHAEWRFSFGNGNFRKLLPTFYAGEGKYTKPAGTEHLWLLETQYHDNGTMSVIRIQNQPYKNADKVWDELGAVPSYDGRIMMAYQTTKTGFVLGAGQGNSTVLSFDPKSKTISCESFYSG